MNPAWQKMNPADFLNESATYKSESIPKYMADSLILCRIRFFVMADSFISHGGLVENDDSAKRINETAMWKNEFATKIDESCAKKDGNQETVLRIHFQQWRIHFGTWRIHEKLMNTPCLLMNKAGKGHFWFSLEVSKRGNLLFFLKKWRIHEKRAGLR